jgi:hypothetical protein
VAPWGWVNGACDGVDCWLRLAFRRAGRGGRAHRQGDTGGGGLWPYASTSTPTRGEGERWQGAYDSSPKATFFPVIEVGKKAASRQRFPVPISDPFFFVSQEFELFFKIENFLFF